jgi:TctA family transporter
LDELSNLVVGFHAVLTFKNILFMLVGVLLGIVVGVLPGLGGPNGVAILLPLTIGMDPLSAIILLSSIYWGALFGGAITSILFNIPGEAWSVATTFDGYPMATQGRAGEALTAAFTASFIGAFAGIAVITLVAPLVAKFALRFGPAEFFAVYFLTFCSFVGMGKENRAKIVVSLCIGYCLTAVGLDQISGDVRLTFDFLSLLSGFDFLVVIIGLFGVSEILLTIEEGTSFKGKAARIDLNVVLKTVAQLPKYWLTILRSAAVGVWMGVTPGGAIAASFMGYGIAKRFSPRRANFGKGEIEGVLAPEIAAHGAGTSALLPMLALGIPGSATAAVLLGGLILWGLQPGPLLFVEQKEFVWGTIASMYVGNIVGLVIVLTTVPIFALIMRVPFGFVAPLILVICAIGAYTVKGSIFHVWLILVFGVVGYLFKKLDYPLAPMVLALVLGDRAEVAFRQAMLGSGGDVSVFWSNGLVGTLMGVALVLLVYPMLNDLLARRPPAS